MNEHPYEAYRQRYVLGVRELADEADLDFKRLLRETPIVQPEPPARFRVPGMDPDVYERIERSLDQVRRLQAPQEFFERLEKAGITVLEDPGRQVHVLVMGQARVEIPFLELEELSSADIGNRVLVALEQLAERSRKIDRHEYLATGTPRTSAEAIHLQALSSRPERMLALRLTAEIERGEDPYALMERYQVSLVELARYVPTKMLAQSLGLDPDDFGGEMHAE